jgi:hypothetical protein
MLADMVRLFVAAAAPLVSMALVEPANLVRESEQSLYAAEFDQATVAIEAALRSPDLTIDTRLALLLQKLRVQQHARLGGITLGDEASTIMEVERIKERTANPDLAGQAGLRLGVSHYFTRLLANDLARVTEFTPTFLRAAEAIEAPCPRAEALFFAALMPQVAGQVAQSKAGLETAQAAAENCPLEQSYVDRHLAAVAEDAGDLAAARMFAARSSAERRRIGFRLFLPFSLLLEARLEERTGNGRRADILLQEAAELAAQLNLPAAQESACEAIVRRSSNSEHCRTGG